MLSVKKKTERELQGMALEIQYLKEQRVRLCRRKSKEMETYRLRADATRREIARLQKRRRTQEIEYIQLKELHEKQSNVLRRKTKVRFLFAEILRNVRDSFGYKNGIKITITILVVLW